MRRWRKGAAAGAVYAQTGLQGPGTAEAGRTSTPVDRHNRVRTGFGGGLARLGRAARFGRGDAFDYGEKATIDQTLDVGKALRPHLGGEQSQRMEVPRALYDALGTGGG